MTSVLPGGNCDGMDSNLKLYASVAYIIIAASAIVIIISFFGCCGAIRENKCMLGTYFTITLALFVLFVVAVALEDHDKGSVLKDPLEIALKKYNDQPTKDKDEAYKKVWNEVQSKVTL